MAEFFDILYKQFFLRDLLGKIVPGAITCFAIYLSFPDVLTNSISLPQGLSWLVGLVLFASFLLVGVCVQTLGELTGIHSAHPRPLISILRNRRGKKARELFRDRISRFGKEANDSQKQQRERYVYLKEGTGNFAIALFILALSLHNNVKLMILVVSISGLSYFAHLSSRSRQAHYEMNVLDLLPKADETEESEVGGKRYTQDEIIEFIGKEI